MTFEFYPPDHSVIQAEFGSACVPYSYADKDHAGKGFWTETQWVNTTAEVSDQSLPPSVPSFESYHHPDFLVSLCMSSY